MSFPRFLSRIHTDFINKIALRSVGRSAIADLEHVGRKSGQVHHTPLRAFRTGDTVVIGVNFGRESDWLKNILASRRCRLRLRKQLLELENPRVVPIAEGMKGMPWAIGNGLKYLVRTRHCVQLTVVSSEPATDRQRAAPSEGRRGSSTVS